ncbi:uncharacterized protein SOCEGT47_035590 [Sorangium cellulosum]|uniref:Uncharacterized protein n=1 Tax=Sorangium cellulosum TaxID=56 RepID=A0A4P2Q1S7_SORCE|nr:uncharacterized protein SOCEGT47_035590 [Sorangium cellulosum]
MKVRSEIAGRSAHLTRSAVPQPIPTKSSRRTADPGHERTNDASHPARSSIRGDVKICALIEEPSAWARAFRRALQGGLVASRKRISRTMPGDEISAPRPAHGRASSPPARRLAARPPTRARRGATCPSRGVPWPRAPGIHRCATTARATASAGPLPRRGSYRGERPCAGRRAAGRSPLSPFAACVRSPCLHAPPPRPPGRDPRRRRRPARSTRPPGRSGAAGAGLAPARLLAAGIEGISLTCLFELARMAWRGHRVSPPPWPREATTRCSR